MVTTRDYTEHELNERLDRLVQVEPYDGAEDGDYAAVAGEAGDAGAADNEGLGVEDVFGGGMGEEEEEEADGYGEAEQGGLGYQ